MSDTKIEMYHVGKTYLEGWYTLDDLKRVIETAERIADVNRRLVDESTGEFKTMAEIAPIVGDAWNRTPSYTSPNALKDCVKGTDNDSQKKSGGLQTDR